LRKLIASCSAVVLLGVTAPAVESASRTVSVKDDFFSPSSKTVKRGTTVVWKFAGRKAHNVVVRSGPVRFKSTVRRGGTYRRKVTRKGTYSIVCTLHSGMAMKLRVR